MATPRNLRILPGGRINGLPGRTIRGRVDRLTLRTNPGPTLFLGGCTYAAAYLILGISGLSLWSSLLAVGGTGLILLGLRKTWER